MARHVLPTLLALTLLACSGGSGGGKTSQSTLSTTLSTVEVAPSSVTADGVATALVTVRALDEEGRPFTGSPVTFAVTGSENQLGSATAETAGDGTASTTVASTRAEVKQVTVTVAGIALPDATVTFVAGPAATLAFTAEPVSLEAGATLSTVRVAVSDAHGNPVPAATNLVELALTGGSEGAALAGTTSVSLATGAAAFPDLSVARAGQGYQLVASAAGLTGATSAAFDVSPAAPDLAASTLEAVPAEAVAGAEIALRVAVQDSFGNAVPGAEVTLTATGSDNLLSQPAATGDDGVAAGALSSTRAEAKTVSAWVGGLPLGQTATATFVAGPPAVLRMLASPAGGVAGATLAEVQVAVADANGNDAGGAVTLSLAGGPTGAALLGTLTAAPGSLAAFGDLSIQTAGSGYVLRASCDTAQVDSAPFAVASAAPATVALASSASPVANGADTTQLTATVRDAFGNPVPGVPVTLEATGTANTLVQPAGPTGDDGTCAGTLASTRAETKSVTAAASGLASPATPVTFVAGPADPAQSDFTATPGTAPADGTTPVALAAVVRDAFGNAVPGVTVAFASTRAADAVVQPAAVTDAAGTATGSLTAATAGTSVLSGTLDGAAFLATRTVRFEGSFAASPAVSALAVSGRTCATGAYANSGHRLSIDAIGTVYLASICGGEGFVAASLDGGKTFGAPVTTRMTGLAQIAVRGGPDGVAYVAGTTAAGATIFTRSTDQGATFSDPVQLGTGAHGDRAASIAVRGDEVFVQPSRTYLVVYRNATRGEGAFASTALSTSTQAVFQGLLVDSTGALWSGLDNSPLFLGKSTDGGVSFSPWAAVSGAAVGFSTWEIGADVIWVAGYYADGPYRISVATPTAGTRVGGLVSSTSYSETAIAVDEAGTAYVALGDGSSGVRLQRAHLTDAAFGAAATVDAAGRNPALAAPKGIDTVVVAYERAGQVWVTVRTY